MVKATTSRIGHRTITDTAHVGTGVSPSTTGVPPVNANSTGGMPVVRTATGETPVVRGFTLVEVMLALVVITLLAILAVVNLSGWTQRGRIEDAGESLETALRMARADASFLGKKMQLRFPEPSQDDSGLPGKIEILWEPDPISKPGKFQIYTTCTWRDFLPKPPAEIISCTLTGPVAFQSADGEMWSFFDENQARMEAITFYPDGSSDSAVIEISISDGTDERTCIVELNGLTGGITSRIMTAEQLVEYHQSSNAREVE